MKTSVIIITLFACIASGCVTRTTVKDEPRQHVRFASQQAAETFYEAYLAIYYPSNKRDSTMVYIATPYGHRKVSSDNVHFNAAVKSADADSDGIISDNEAAAYAKKVATFVWFVPPPNNPPNALRAAGNKDSENVNR
jgi:hypothetical protein